VLLALRATGFPPPPEGGGPQPEDLMDGKRRYRLGSKTAINNPLTMLAITSLVRDQE
jgi:hypothetical protein